MSDRSIMNMKTHEGGTSLPHIQCMETGRRIIMFPLPFQGHRTFMIRLANILHSRGFEITIIHTEYNSPNYSNFPHFTFKSIKDRFLEIGQELPKNRVDSSYYLTYLNRSCVDPFKECLASLLEELGRNSVACLITDAAFYFTQAVADDLNLPRLVLRTSSLGCILAYDALPFHSKNGCFYLTEEDPGYEEAVPEYPLLKAKDAVKISINPRGYGDFVTNMIKQMKASSGLIWNTFKELEEPELEEIYKDFAVPSFTLGPLHKNPSAPWNSLTDEYRNILSWLENKPPKSTIYVFLGSVASITEQEFQEVAHALANTGLPFLWVVRPRVVRGSEWPVPFPHKFLESVGDRGRVVKCAPHYDVLIHPATGCFWTQSDWFSTVESICEGVPLICSPCFIDQPIIARYVSNVWKIGVMLEDELERGAIEMAIKRVMLGKEGEEIRERTSGLKEKLNHSLGEGGSSRESLNNLVDYISSF